jgi:hypothetical protein
VCLGGVALMLFAFFRSFFLSCFLCNSTKHAAFHNLPWSLARVLNPFALAGASFLRAAAGGRSLLLM